MFYPVLYWWTNYSTLKNWSQEHFFILGKLYYDINIETITRRNLIIVCLLLSSTGPGYKYESNVARFANRFNCNVSWRPREQSRLSVLGVVPSRSVLCCVAVALGDNFRPAQPSFYLQLHSTPPLHRTAPAVPARGPDSAPYNRRILYKHHTCLFSLSRP